MIERKLSKEHSVREVTMKAPIGRNSYYSADGIFHLREEEPGNWTLIDLRNNRALYGIDSYRIAINIILGA
jgi:hypothetical protein